MSLKNRKGVTLIEIIISIALLAIVVAGVFPLFSTTMKVNKENKRRQEIHENIIKEIESYRSKNYKEIINDGAFDYKRLSDDESYEIVTKIEFEKDDLIGDGNYGYLQMQIIARDVSSGETLDRAETYISNNGDDTTIFVRIKNEWQEPNKSMDWIVGQRVTLENILNHTTEVKETDALGKILYLDPPMGRYKIDLNQGKYKISASSPDKIGDEFSVKKGCTTYVEYWMYEPIRMSFNIGPKLALELCDKDDSILFESRVTNKYYNDYSRIDGISEIRPLGTGNSNCYKLKIEKGILGDDVNGLWDELIEENPNNGYNWGKENRIKFGNWRYGSWYKYSWHTRSWQPTGQKFGDHGQLLMFEQNGKRPKSGLWTKDNSETGHRRHKWFYSIEIPGEWTTIDDGTTDAIYYKDPKKNEYKKLTNGEFRLTKNEDGDFVFLLNKEKNITFHVGSNDLDTTPINPEDKIEIQILK
ncbi:MAG: prepilin-type N-terminal cleavage/methylation domain-containing protein [Tissierellales bacterium]|jgi:prepilin-type N-terminal cleavage/methylation domain-containing protein|nr:prepilin-type N-terminal cleavage/methylation domain-containing protein [Tissierellales bacterium]